MATRISAALRAKRWLATGSCLLVALAVFLLTSGKTDSTEAKKSDDKAIVPLFAKTEKAENPVQLNLQVDVRKVLGWIGGTEDFSGQEVKVKIDDRVQKVKVGEGNVFTWDYRVTEPATVEFRVGRLTQSANLKPRPTTQPNVFFVVDRTLYRPTQALQFAGFLRKADDNGEFQPLANRAVEAMLISQRKKSTVAKMKLTSDDFGRITGTYTFQDADPLDTYDLTIPGYKGSAVVTLGEYRKSKVKLTIEGHVEKSKMKLKFQAVDFLDKPVAGSRVTFTAQVVHRAQNEKKHALKAEEFVDYAPLPLGTFEPESLSEDERLLWEANTVGFMPSALGGATVLAQVQGEIALKDKEPGEYAIALEKDWLRDGCAIVVRGVVVDTNGREQNAVRTIPLSGKSSALELEMSKRYFAVDEKIEVKARAKDETGKALEISTSLVAMRLTPSTERNFNAWNDRYHYRSQAYNMNINQQMLFANDVSPRHWRWRHVQPTESAKRSLTTAVSFKGDTAALKLSEPGAYKLVAIAQLSDGTTLQNEVGCVVRDAETMPALVLQLDKDEVAAGDTLTGSLHSRFTDARVLLTIRDGTGIRYWKTLQLSGGVAMLREKLPADLRYGCYVDVQYTDKGDRVHIADKLIRVTPSDRMLTIKTSVKEVCMPGETIKIDLQVNREEPVDLVVSVYDQSLLGIAADKSIDIRNFYLADESVRNGIEREALRRRLGMVTVGQLVAKAKKIVKANKDHLKEEDDDEIPSALTIASLQQLLQFVESKQIMSMQAITLLRLAGIETQPDRSQAYYSNYWKCSLDEKKSWESQVLFDVLEASVGDWRLAFQSRGNVLMLREAHPSYDLQSFNRIYTWGDNFRGFNARGDSHRSISGNSSHSVEGQGFISHMPGAGSTVPLIQTDADQSGIMVRRDFSDSAFWNAAVRTDSKGKASVAFKLPDSLTNWQIVVTGISQKMHVGQAKDRCRTFKPIMVWPMLPRVFTEGDVVDVFASVHNVTDDRQTIRVKLKVENGEVLDRAETSIVVGPKSNAPVYWRFRPGQAGFTQLLMSAECEAGADASLKRLPVTRAAAEQLVTKSGFCKEGAVFQVPSDVDLTSARLDITFAPSLAADMADTLNFLVDYPYGCVEQTMSRFLPAIKVAQVLKQYQVDHAELNKKLPGCVAGGIKRLLELQQADGGWGWHGASATHEMMTPYALYGLLQAEKAGYDMPNETAIQRGLDRLGHFIDGMNEAQTADRIYCIYVFSHRRPVKDEWWTFIAGQAKKSKLSDYALALALEIAVQKDKKELAARLSDTLHARATKEGAGKYWKTAGFGHWGDDRFEITAAVMKALVAHDKNDPMIDDILAFFAATKRGDRWNSTKDTAMIVFAMCDYLAKQETDARGQGELSFKLNSGAESKFAFENGKIKKVEVAADQLKKGENKLVFATKAPNVMYRLVLRYWQTGRDIKPLAKGIEVTRRLYLLDGKGGRTELKSGDTVSRGAYLESEITAKNTHDQEMRYVLVDNPKFSSCEILPVEDQRFRQDSTAYALREDRTASVVYHHESAPGQIVDRCVLLAELAGEFLAPPASVEMMYQTETRGHSGLFVLKVKDEVK